MDRGVNNLQNVLEVVVNTKILFIGKSKYLWSWDMCQWYTTGIKAFAANQRAVLSALCSKEFLSTNALAYFKETNLFEVLEDADIGDKDDEERNEESEGHLATIL